METENTTTQPAPVHFCCAGIQLPGSAQKARRAEVQPPPTATTPRNTQKPWSVFGDVYWI